MIILGIESSCDDTSVALLEANESGFKILAEKTASQIEVHKKYGGVVPEIAGRCHAENIMPLIEQVVDGKEQVARNKKQSIDAIAVTSGPGLITGLLVGIEAAKNLSYLWNVPLIGVNHIEGHIHSVEILPTPVGISPMGSTNPEAYSEIINHKSKIAFPALCLIVSGGHTELILMRDHGDYEIIGATVDDAAGECFDKVAKLLGFDYPGGPKISKFAAEGNPQAIDFPRPMLRDDSYKFSFAGLKTSALYWLRDHGVLEAGMGSEYRIWNLESGISVNDFCASFEQAIIDVLITKTMRAAEQYKPRTIVLGGGVSANKKLRETLTTAVNNQILNSKFEIPNSRLQIPSPAYAMDNAAMIAVAGYYHALKKEYTPWRELKADPNWKVDDRSK